jgi:adenylate cyclase
MQTRPHGTSSVPTLTNAQDITSPHALLPQPDSFQQVFRTEALAGLKLATLGRVVSLLVVGGLLLYIVPLPEVFYYELLLVIFLILGLGYYRLSSSRFSRAWLGYAFISLDYLLLTYTVFVPNPWAAHALPCPMTIRHGPIVYYFLLMAAIAFSYSPNHMLWAGLSSAASWSLGIAWLLAQPGTLTSLDMQASQSFADHVAIALDPHYVDLDMAVQNGVLLLLIAGLLSVVVRRSRHLVIHQTEVVRERANLARYFSPNVLDEVASADGPLTAVRKHEVAILFADIVGFTTLAETMPPEEVMELLRAYHSRMEAEVFRFGGTLDKFIGDAVMASFGAPRRGAHDATDGLRCAHAMLAAIEAWNQERHRRRETPIRIGIGLHYGPAVMGDVGSERCAAFAVIGDTTNTTSRLQSLTRSLDTDMVVSHALVEAVCREMPGAQNELVGLSDLGPQPIRGRAQPLPVWGLREAMARTHESRDTMQTTQRQHR